MNKLAKRILISFALLPSLLLGNVRSFPMSKSVFDTDEIISQYQPYLSFVLEVGKGVDQKNTQKLFKVYQALQKKSPEYAALFLKGLRFEMITKVDLMGVDQRTLNSNHPEMKKWVARYLTTWVREADEQLFRSSSNSSLAKAD